MSDECERSTRQTGLETRMRDPHHARTTHTIDARFAGHNRRRAEPTTDAAGLHDRRRPKLITQRNAPARALPNRMRAPARNMVHT
eukprot:10457512-Alexandrium_andersonii.AAC.1